MVSEIVRRVAGRMIWCGANGLRNCVIARAPYVRVLHIILRWLLYVPPGLSFDSSTFCPHGVFMCFMWIWEQTAIISVYSINWLVFTTETECVYCAVRTGSLYTASLTFSNSTFCPDSVFMCFVWIWEQTGIISLYSINWLVFITETECVYCAVRTGYLYIIQVSFSGL